MKGAIRLNAVIMRPFLAPRLLLGRRERRYAISVLRILHHEPFRGFRKGDDVVTLSEKMHPFAVEDLQHLVIGRHVVGCRGRPRARPVPDPRRGFALRCTWRPRGLRPGGTALSTRSRIALN